MNPLTRFCRWWLEIEEEGPEFVPLVTHDDAVFRAGVQQGVAIGELRGRNGAVMELEAMLVARGKNEFEAEDVARLKYRTFH